MIFGTETAEEEEANSNHFLAMIRRILREALDGLFAASEVGWTGTIVSQSEVDWTGFTVSYL